VDVIVIVVCQSGKLNDGGWTMETTEELPPRGGGCWTKGEDGSVAGVGDGDQTPACDWLAGDDAGRVWGVASLLAPPEEFWGDFFSSLIIFLFFYSSMMIC
jgi:hypothetical protein